MYLNYWNSDLYSSRLCIPITTSYTGIGSYMYVHWQSMTLRLVFYQISWLRDLIEVNETRMSLKSRISMISDSMFTSVKLLNLSWPVFDLIAFLMHLTWLTDRSPLQFQTGKVRELWNRLWHSISTWNFTSPINTTGIRNANINCK